MFRRLWVSIQRDNQINLRNGYYLVTILVALIYLGFIYFLIPKDASLQPVLYVFDQTEERLFAQRAAGEKAESKVVPVSSLGELEQAVEGNQNSVGIHLTPGKALPQAALYFQSYQNQKVRSLMVAATEAELRELYGAEVRSEVPVETTVLRDLDNVPKIPFNKLWVPILLFSDAGMIGLIFIAALIFMEKEEGTLKAYMVTPGRVWEYLLSKSLTLAFLAGLFTLVLVPPVLGTQPNYPQLLAVMFVLSIFSSLLGAWIAVHFDNISQFLFPAIAMMLVIGLPSVAYFVPSFSPWWLKALPTYSLVFGLKEAVFPTGSPGSIYQALLVLFGAILVLLALASRAFKRQLVSR